LAALTQSGNRAITGKRPTSLVFRDQEPNHEYAHHDADRDQADQDYEVRQILS